MLILGLDCSAALVGSQGQALRAREVRVLDSRPSQRSSLRQEVQAAVQSATVPTLPTPNSEEAFLFVRHLFVEATLNSNQSLTA